MAITPITAQPSPFPFKQATIGLILAKVLFQKYLNFRQYKKLSRSDPIPSEIKELDIPEEKLNKTKEYNRATLQFEIISDSVSIGIDLALLCLNFWVYLWDYSGEFLAKQGFDPNNEYYRALVFLFIETIKDKLIGLPFSIYKTFVLEEKYGFNKTTPLLFVKDLVLGLILSIIITPIILWLILWAIAAGGKYFYIYVEIVVIIIAFVGMWIYPNFIAPLFNKFSELEDGSLKQSLYKLAETVQFPLTKIYVVDASKRTAHSNAYMYGFGKNKRIVLFDTLLKQLQEDEIEAVLCHELGHWKLNHTVKNLLNVFSIIFTMFYVYGYFMNEDTLFLSFGFSNMSIFIGLALFMQASSGLFYIAELLLLKLTRRFEYQADEFAFNMGRGDQLQSGLKKLFKENLADVDPDPVYAAFNYSHPTLLERIRFLKTLEEKKK